jgi:molecular chaperone DnaJ
MDYYQILEVDKKASLEDIKKSYRKLAKKYHPDANQGNTENEVKFKQITEAYEVLGDEQKRAYYDRHGSGQPYQSGGNPFDFFSSFYNEFSKRSTPGKHIVVYLHINMKEAYHGCKKEATYMQSSVCSKCNGSKGTMGACKSCDGRGFITIHGNNLNVKASCRVCQGTGKVIQEECTTCSGKGITEPKETKITVQIPMGIEHAQQLTFFGKGEASLDGGNNGNLVVVVLVDEHKIFSRVQQGRRLEYGGLYCKVPVTYSQLVKGSEIEVPTFEGPVVFQMPSGTQPGTRFKIQGKGFPRSAGDQVNKGDMFVQVVLEVPALDKLPEGSVEIVDKLAEIESSVVMPLREEFDNFQKDTIY